MEVFFPRRGDAVCEGAVPERLRTAGNTRRRALAGDRAHNLAQCRAVFVFKALHGEALPLINAGEDGRDFIYVRDVCEGLLRCAVLR
jgi:nucleoside-diphosphate-sugar epimerase